MTADERARLKKAIDEVVRKKTGVSDICGSGRRRESARNPYSDINRDACAAMTDSGASCHFKAKHGSHLCGVHLARLERRAAEAPD